MTETMIFEVGMLEHIVETRGIPIGYLPCNDMRQLLAMLESPKWSEAAKVHDWRNHVPACVRDSWARLSLESRLIATLMAEGSAYREEWD